MHIQGKVTIHLLTVHWSATHFYYKWKFTTFYYTAFSSRRHNRRKLIHKRMALQTRWRHNSQSCSCIRRPPESRIYSAYYHAASTTPSTLTLAGRETHGKYKNRREIRRTKSQSVTEQTNVSRDNISNQKKYSRRKNGQNPERMDNIRKGIYLVRNLHIDVY